MEDKKTLILIDGHALAFRQYYALERTAMKTSNGVETWAVYGFFKSVFDLLQNNHIKPDCIAVAFDVGRHTFRVDAYDGYKAQRDAMPDSLHSQLGLIIDGLNAFNIPIYTKEGFEADDVIGTIVTNASELGHKTYILTGDQDSFQLIDKNGLVTVLIPSKGLLTEYNWNKVYEKLGVYPDQIIDYKALRGDTSDNIPGIKGIGEKTAQKLLAQYPHLEEILTNLDNIKENAVRNKLKDGVEIAKLSKYLATIVRDVDIDFNFDDTKVELPDTEKVITYLKSLQFYSFIKNIDKILCSFDKNCDNQIVEKREIKKEETSIVKFKEDTNGQGQLGLFAISASEVVNNETYEKQIISNIEELEKLEVILNKQKSFSFDIISNFENARENDIVGCAFAIKADKIKTFYVPFKTDYKNLLKQIYENKTIKKYTFNAKNNINILKTAGIYVENIVFDTFLASYIKNPNRNHELSSQALDFINHISVELHGLNKKTKLIDLSEKELSDYSEDRAFVIYKLTEYWYENLSKEELKLHDDIELPVTFVLSNMEYTGVSINTGYMQELSDYMTLGLKELEEKIYNISQEPFNINSPKQVGEILYNKLGIKGKKKRGKTQLSTSIDVLEELAEDNEICKYIIDYRKYAKLKSTYTDSLPLLISKVDNRIHTSFNQTIAVTGRLSSSNPNLQNIPIRTEDGNKIRNAFSAENSEDYILSSDYSQIELRLLAHISGDKHLIQAFNDDIDVHSLTASKAFNVPIEQVTKDMRRKAKAVNFGIIYGQTRYGLAKALNISPNEAQSFIDVYFLTFPKVKEYMDYTVDFAYEHGYVETIFGRKRYLENELSSPNRMIKEFAQRAAINQPIQGTAADLIKMAMIDVDKKLQEQNLKSKMIMQVHDELVFEVKQDELDKIKELVKNSMENIYKFDVKMLVDINWGKSWKEQ